MSEDPKPKRPKRRRRRGRSGSPAGDGPNGGQTGDAAGGSSGDGGERGAKRRRPSRRPSRSDSPASDDSGRPTRRRRRRRGQRGSTEDDNQRASGSGGRPSNTADAANAAAAAPGIDDIDDIDAGWDAASGPDEGAVGTAAEPAATSPDEREPWGDDADAPTPDVRLAPDLPANPPADDPDPATAYLDDADEEPAPTEQGGPVGATERDVDDAHDDIDDSPVRDVVGIKFATAGRIYEYDACGADLTVGSDVVVETDRGTRVGTVALAMVRRPHASGKLKKVLRPANAQDRLILDSNRERAAEALVMAREATRKKRIKAKIFRAELSFGGTKLVVYYSSEDRVDLRDVQNQLARKLDCRVELRQIGVRDAAKLIGGIGSCGRELCCSTFLPAFAPVSIKMAKDQNMVLNPTKVSGQCGRLKCCLVYEQETYATMRKGLPKMGKRVITDDGEGRVVEVDVLRQRIRVSLGPGEFRVYPAEQVKRKFPPQEQKPPKPPAEAGEREPGEQS